MSLAEAPSIRFLTSQKMFFAILSLRVPVFLKNGKEIFCLPRRELCSPSGLGFRETRWRLTNDQATFDDINQILLVVIYAMTRKDKYFETIIGNSLDDNPITF